MAPLRFTDRFRCPDHPQIEFATPSPQLFSFNNPYGAARSAPASARCCGSTSR
jgi:excinuclease UvrABC ATPase subunit